MFCERNGLTLLLGFIRFCLPVSEIFVELALIWYSTAGTQVFHCWNAKLKLTFWFLLGRQRIQVKPTRRKKRKGLLEVEVLGPGLLKVGILNLHQKKPINYSVNDPSIDFFCQLCVNTSNITTYVATLLCVTTISSPIF